eukprot:gene7832-9646_t
MESSTRNRKQQQQENLPNGKPTSSKFNKIKEKDFDSSKDDETSSEDEIGHHNKGISSSSSSQKQQVNMVDNVSATDPASSKYKKLLVRSIMGAMMIGFFIIILSTDHFIVSLFVIALQLLVFKEMISLRYIEAKEKKIPRFRTLAWLFLFSAFHYLYAKPILIKLSTYYPDIFTHFVRYHLWHSFSLYCIGFVSFIFTLRKGLYRYQFSQFTWTLMTLLMVVVQSNFLISNIYSGLIWFILPVSIIVCNDIFAYLNGFFLGKKFIQRPLMKISPNKTWEGFIGATFWTLLFAYYFAGFLLQFEWVTCPKGNSGIMETLHCTPDPVFLPKEFIIPTEVSSILSKYIGLNITSFKFIPIQYHALVLALFGSLIAPFGGFFASGIKRAYKIKDFDTIFPGHGGVTDRTDCQFIMGLFIYVYYLTFIKTSELDPSQIWHALVMLPLDEKIVILEKLNASIQIENNIKCIPIDLNNTSELPNESPYHLIIHKFTDELADIVNNQDNQNKINSIQKILNKYPGIVQVDKLENQKPVLDRVGLSTLLDKLNQLPSNFNIRCPSFIVIENESNDYTDQLKKQNVSFPVVCKPIQACGSKESHELGIVFKEEDLHLFKPPMLVQEYINHDAVIYKVFVIGDNINIVKRKSLRNMKPDETQVITFNSQKPLPSTLLPEKDIDLSTVVSPPSETLDSISKGIQKDLGLTLFGFDLITDSNSKKHGIVDLNYFPGMFFLQSVLLTFIMISLY